MHLLKCSSLLLWVSIFNLWSANAQKTNIENLVFAGAGLRGVAYGGAVQILEQQGVLKKIKNVAGNSAGSITALLLSLKYNYAEIDSLLSTTKFEDFNDGKNSIIGGANRIINNYGWYRGEVFMQWLEKAIAYKTGNKDITFKQLTDNGYINLHIVAACVNRQKLLVFNNQNYPNMPIKNAVRASMSIPYYYQAVYLDSAGNIHEQADSTLDLVVDGGIMNNYPLHLFDAPCKKSNCVSKYIANKKTLGFRVIPQDVLEKDSLLGNTNHMEINSLKDFNLGLYTLFMDYTSVSNLEMQDVKRTIDIGDVHISARIRKLSPKERESMLKSGAEATLNYFNNK